MYEDYDDGYDAGYESGYEVGYESGKDSREWEIEDLEKDLARIRFFMSIRLDQEDGYTVLDIYERIQPSEIDRMMHHDC